MPPELQASDSVRLTGRPHGVALARPLVRALVSGAIGVALVLSATRFAWPLGAAGAALLALAALAALRAVLAWDRTMLLLTDAELIVVYGIVRRRSAAVRLDGTPLEVEQTLLGRLLGYGTIVAGDLEVPYVPEAPRLVDRRRASARRARSQRPV